MRNGWRKICLGDVLCQSVRPVLVEPGHEYRRLGVSSYAAGVVLHPAQSGTAIRARTLFAVAPGQFVYSRLGAVTGAFALADGDAAGSVVSNEFPVFDVDDSRILPEYLLRWFEQPSVWKQVDEQATGSGQRRWHERQLLQYEIPLPPLDEQRRIVDLIGALDATIAATEGLGGCLSALLDAMRTRVFRGPDPSGVFSQYAVLQRGYDLPVQDRADGPVPVIASNGPVGRHSVHKVEAPGVVTGRSGTIGKVQYLDDDFWPLNTTLYVKDFKGNHPRLIRHLLISMDLASHAGGSTVPSLNRNVLDRVPVFVPDGVSQEEIANRLDSVDEAACTARAQAERLRDLRSHLLTALLSGEHEIPESYDEVMEATA